MTQYLYSVYTVIHINHNINKLHFCCRLFVFAHGVFSFLFFMHGVISSVIAWRLFAWRLFVAKRRHAERRNNVRQKRQKTCKDAMQKSKRHHAKERQNISFKWRLFACRFLSFRAEISSFRMAFFFLLFVWGYFVFSHGVFSSFLAVSFRREKTNR